MKKTPTSILFSIAFFLLGILPAAGQAYVLDSIQEYNGYTYLAKPTGPGPFPAVLYSHGGLGGQIGGDLRGTCIALAEAGYASWAQLRTDTVPITPHVGQVETSLDSLLSRPYVNTSKIGIIGFSRGGLLTLMTVISRASEVHAIVSMAPAAAGSTLTNTLSQVATIDDSVLVLVALNDLYQDDHVQLAIDVTNALVAEGKGVRHIEYPEYDADNNGTIDANDDGHELFWEVQEPYWSDMIAFLDNNLKGTTSIDEDKNSANKIQLYPNPAGSNSTIFIESENTAKEMELYDASGRLLAEWKNPKTTIDLSAIDLNKGLYLLSILDKNGNYRSAKLAIK